MGLKRDFFARRTTANLIECPHCDRVSSCSPQTPQYVEVGVGFINFDCVESKRQRRGALSVADVETG